MKTNRSSCAQPRCVSLWSVHVSARVTERNQSLVRTAQCVTKYGFDVPSFFVIQDICLIYYTALRFQRNRKLSSFSTAAGKPSPKCWRIILFVYSVALTCPLICLQQLGRSSWCDGQNFLYSEELACI